MGTPLRLLMVEDSDDDAQLLLVKVRRAGYQPDYVRVDNEPDLREALRDPSWQIVISDYAMPGFSGLKALQILRDATTPIYRLFWYPAPSAKKSPSMRCAMAPTTTS